MRLFTPDDFVDKWNFWGFGDREEIETAWNTDSDKVRYSYTPLRQTVVLLMAAMAGEL